MAESLEDAKVKVNHQHHGHDCESLGVKRYTRPVEDAVDLSDTKPMRYVSLHHHTTYSYLDGFALPEAHVRRIAELGGNALAVTEHGNISSHVQLEKATRKADYSGVVKPIFGCEIYADRQLDRQRKNHLTVLAATQEGYRNLLRLVSRGWDQFYYEPTVTFDDLAEHSEGLIVLSGCTGSELTTSLIGGKNIDPDDASYRRAKRVAQEYAEIFPGRYYLECQAFPELENVCTVNQAWAQLGEELGLPLVATGDVHYTQPTESEIQKILHSLRSGGRHTPEDLAKSWGYDVPLCPPVSDAVMIKRLIGTGLTRAQAQRAVLVTEEIAQGCNVELPKMQMPKFPLPVGYDDTYQFWVDKLREGWRFRKIDQRPNARQYVHRLRMEREIVESKNFLDYFLFVSDMIVFAKSRDIWVGPGRGSSAASLICYLLRITEVDPMLYPDLLFERFIDHTRKDLPDIDVDFDDERRHEVLEYLVAKYGEAQVGNIGSFTKYKSKLALDDVARVYRIPKFKVSTVKDLLVERSSGDLRASATIEDTMAMFPQAADVFRENPDLGAAMDLEGNVKGMGVHAAGVVVASGPLTDVCAIYSRMVNGHLYQVLSVDKYDAEYLNILKMDNLGLTTGGVIGRTLKMLERPLTYVYDNIPLDDAMTLEGFKNNDVVGIFQFDGRAMRGVNGELRPDDFEEVALVTALARPGPLHNGATAEYIDVKRGFKEARQFHPLVAPLVDKTKGQIVYQEQILRICGEIGGFEHTHRAEIRKIISRKIGEQEFMRWMERFVAGAAERGVPREDAERVWKSCVTAGSYAFNIAHSIGYGLIAWWTMFLKQHHPLEFYAASLQKYKDKDKQMDLMRDAEAHGIEIRPPHPQYSRRSWSGEGGQYVSTEWQRTGEQGAMGLRAGFKQINGIGDIVADKIIEYIDEHGVVDWNELTAIKGIGPKTVERIEEFIASDDPFGIHRLERKIAEVKRAIRNGEVPLPWPTHTAAEVPYSREDTNTQVVWIGELTRRNLRELFELHFSRTGEDLDPDTVNDPHLNEWVVMEGNDDTEKLTMTVSRWNYPRLMGLVWQARLGVDLVVVKGFKRGNQARRAIYVTDMWVLSERRDEDDEEAKALEQ